MDRAKLEYALTQVLENFQRCGLARFEAKPFEALPAELQATVAELAAAQRPATQTVSGAEAGAAAPGAATRPAGGAARPHVADTARPAAAHVSHATSTTHQASSHQAPSHQASSTTPSQRPPQSGSQPAGEVLPLVGLAAQPWSLPPLAPHLRQEPLDAIAGKARDCRLCSAIVSYRQQTVFGAGSLTPRVCFVGEAPGSEEDRSGQPFVGPAGQLLTKIIAAMQLTRDAVYILNALKCRPPQNRTPLNEEIENCRHFVESQLDVLQPEFIVCLGAVAVRSILQTELPIGRLRGQFHRYRGARVVVTYHPSYLLSNASAKRMVWEDMQMLMAEL